MSWPASERTTYTQSPGSAPAIGKLAHNQDSPHLPSNVGVEAEIQSGGQIVSRADRLESIQELQEARRGTSVIVYVTSTRPGAESEMSMDAVRRIFDHLEAVGRRDKIDLFIHSNGGDGIVPWRLVTLIRQFTDEFTVLVPHRAFSAATLTALGADHVVMHPMGMLGPTDPTVANAFNPRDPSGNGNLLGISVEDVASYLALVKDDVGIHHEDELIQAFSALTEHVHPLALGNVKRSTLQSRMMGAKLLQRRTSNELTDHMVEDIVRKLASELYFHGHAIDVREAEVDIGLNFVRSAAPGEAEAMWRLYKDYERDMQLLEEFNPLLQAANQNPQNIPPLGGQITWTPVELPPVCSVMIESTAHCDSFERVIEVALARDTNGAYLGTLNVIRQGWVRQ